MRKLSVAADQHTGTAIAGIARRLIQQLEAPTSPLDPGDTDSIDVDLALIEAASSVLTQLGLLQRWFIRGGEHPRIITGIVDLAQSYGIGSNEAIGVSGTLVGVLCDADESQIGHLLARAHRQVSDHDLVAGAASLLAATTCYLADALGEPPLAVHDEVHRRPGGSSIHLRNYCRDRS